MTDPKVQTVLRRLEELIQQGRFEELEDNGLEIKPLPPTSGDWTERYKSINAFLNTQGGILILGVREEGQGPARRYVLGSYYNAEDRLKEIPRLFTDRSGCALNLTDRFPPMQVQDLLSGRVVVVYVDELPADRKFVFYKGAAFKRVLTGDHKLREADIERQEEFKQEAAQARELQPVPGRTLDDIDLDKLNDYITWLNQPAPIETKKPDLVAALPFLERKYLVKDGAVTLLGMLVCGMYPGDRLGFRCHVHAYVDVPQEIARDKRDFVDNILPLMDRSYVYVLQNIHVGISPERGGTRRPQYPEALLREMINNALAHRDYGIDRQVIISILPGARISIRNPGDFRPHLLIEEEATAQEAQLRRILPESKPRNPKLAEVLRVYRRWEGRGVGMATLVNLCLQNEMDLPTYRLRTEEVELHLSAGRLMDGRMARLFSDFDRYIEEKSGRGLSGPQMLVLAYLIKSEWANERGQYTILLTEDNNHFTELATLERAGLIYKHHRSTPRYPIYVADRTLLARTFRTQLRERFGDAFDALDDLRKDALDVIYRFNRFSKMRTPGLEPISEAVLSLQHEGEWDLAESISAGRLITEFSQQMQMALRRLVKEGFLVREGPRRRGYAIQIQD